MVSNDEGAATATAERRQWVREMVDSAAVLRATQPQTLAQALWARVLDVSSGGVGFSTDTPLAVGSVYRFDVCDRRQRAARAEVRRCELRADGLYRVGAAFC